MVAHWKVAPGGSHPMAATACSGLVRSSDAHSPASLLLSAGQRSGAASLSSATATAAASSRQGGAHLLPHGTPLQSSARAVRRCSARAELSPSRSPSRRSILRDGAVEGPMGGRLPPRAGSPSKLRQAPAPQHGPTRSSRPSAPVHDAAGVSMTGDLGLRVRSTAPAKIPPQQQKHQQRQAEQESQAQDSLLEDFKAWQHVHNKQLLFLQPALEMEEASSIGPEGMLPSRGLTEEGTAFREQFLIRWYEVGGRSTASMETMANLLQESATGHAAAVGFAGDGLAATPIMRSLRLIWIITKMHIHMDEYPRWGDMVEIETWMQLESSLTARREWVIRLASSGGREIGRATSCLMMMNQDSRRVARIPPTVHDEMVHLCPTLPRYAVAPKEVPKIANVELAPPEETPADLFLLHSKDDLSARRADLDMNQHVNNVTYISWMLEALPQNVVEHLELMQITLEYRRECKHQDVVQSLAQPNGGRAHAQAPTPASVPAASAPRAHCTGAALEPEGALSAPAYNVLEGITACSGHGHGVGSERSFAHVLRLQDPSACSLQWKEINKGNTVWRVTSQ